MQSSLRTRHLGTDREMREERVRLDCLPRSDELEGGVTDLRSEERREELLLLVRSGESKPDEGSDEVGYEAASITRTSTLSHRIEGTGGF